MNFLNVKYEKVKSILKKMRIYHYLGPISESPVLFSFRHIFLPELSSVESPLQLYIVTFGNLQPCELS